MKIIIIGASTSGKSTIKNLLSGDINKVPILEIDDELERLNGGQFPEDLEYKNKVLAPRIIEEILNKDKIIFFSNTNYVTIKDLKTAKSKGFKVIQLDVSLDEMQQRNKYRMDYTGYDDLSKWFEGMIKYQEEIRKNGLVDKVIDANQPLVKVLHEIKDYIKD